MDDNALLKNIAEGDRAAIRILVDTNKNLVWHIIISMAGRNTDNEDMFQEVFLQVFKSLKRFRADSRLSSWIGSIAHNVCVDYLRRKKKSRDLYSREPDESGQFKYSTDKSWQKYDQADLNNWVLEAISGLPLSYRTVVTLYHLDERSYAEISEITGMPDGTVKSYISRGRTMLREILTKLVPDITEILNDY
jgi:RNA polymerase sigma-70 factor (ECF subfamily)